MTTISVITVCLNAAATLARTIESVRAQKDAAIEHILIDGGSTDATMDIVQRYEGHFAKIVSERDRGLYDAMNKGLALAQGHLLGFLNADDAFAGPGVMARLVRAWSLSGVDAVYGDVLQVDARNRAVRLIRGDTVSSASLRRGLMPPHPGFYVRTDALRRAGGFNTTYKLAADFDLVARLFLTPGFRAGHVPGVVTEMRIGGRSTQGLKSTRLATSEIWQICRTLGIDATFASLLSRYTLKAREVAEGQILRFRGKRPV